MAAAIINHSNGGRDHADPKSRCFGWNADRGNSFAGRASGDQPKPKYYFTISNITSEDKTIISLAKELLAKEISARSEFTQDLGGAEGEAAAFAEMKKRGLKGFQVNLRIMTFKQEIKPPAPGRRDRQMAIQVKLGVYGTTYPGGKLSFTGDGEASLTGDFSDRRMESRRGATEEDGPGKCAQAGGQHRGGQDDHRHAARFTPPQETQGQVVAAMRVESGETMRRLRHALR